MGYSTYHWNLSRNKSPMDLCPPMSTSGSVSQLDQRPPFKLHCIRCIGCWRPEAKRWHDEKRQIWGLWSTQKLNRSPIKTSIYPIKYQKYPEHIGHCETNIWPMVHTCPYYHGLTGCERAKEPWPHNADVRIPAVSSNVAGNSRFLWRFFMGHSTINGAFYAFSSASFDYRKVSYRKKVHLQKRMTSPANKSG